MNKQLQYSIFLTTCFYAIKHDDVTSSPSIVQNHKLSRQIMAVDDDVLICPIMDVLFNISSTHKVCRHLASGLHKCVVKKLP